MSFLISSIYNLKELVSSSLLEAGQGSIVNANSVVATTAQEVLLSPRSENNQSSLSDGYRSLSESSEVALASSIDADSCKTGEDEASQAAQGSSLDDDNDGFDEISLDEDFEPNLRSSLDTEATELLSEFHKLDGSSSDDEFLVISRQFTIEEKVSAGTGWFWKK